MNALLRVAGCGLIALAVGLVLLLDDQVNGSTDHPISVLECLVVLAGIASAVTGIALLVLGDDIIPEKGSD